MDNLIEGLVVFCIELYVKFYVLVAIGLAFYKYYTWPTDANLISMELILVFALASIVLSSLVLSKIDCTQIANYFKLPVMTGLAYINLAYIHHRKSSDSHRYHPQTLLNRRKAAISGGGGGAQSKLSSQSTWWRVDSGEPSSPFLVDTIELVLSNGLALMVLLQLATNLFGKRLIKLITNARPRQHAISTK